MELKKKVYLLGSIVSQNELMADYIRNKLGYDTHFDHISHLEKIIQNSNGHNILVMIDCSGKGIEDIWSITENKMDLSDKQAYLVLFNVMWEYENDIEREALARGVQGIFFDNNPLTMIEKGIETIFSGELWFSRKTMSQLLKDANINGNNWEDKSVVLTGREKMILRLITSGLSNPEIADSLGVSPYTVKTHVHNIFKKIEVPSRLQAALWAVTYMR